MSDQNANSAAVKAYFDAFAAHDPEPIRPLLADKAVLVIPYSQAGGSEPFAVFDGVDEVMGYMNQICEKFSKTIMKDQKQYVTADGSVIFLEGSGDLVNGSTGKPYSNVYLYKFVFEDGKIVHIDEYANPVTFALGVGLPIGEPTVASKGSLYE